MVVLAHQQAVFDAGGAAVFFVGDVVDVGDGGGAVAACRPGAVLVAADDGAADRLGDVVGVADVEGDALAVELATETPIALVPASSAVERLPGYLDAVLYLSQEIGRARVEGSRERSSFSIS